MIDETPAALYQAGPANWHHLIAPTKTFPMTEGAAQFVASTADATVGTQGGITVAATLTDLAAAAIILSNAIANNTLTADAQDTFKGARNTAGYLDIINTHIPPFTPTIHTYTHLKRALDTKDTNVLSALLIDIIRIANHITN